MERNVHTDRGHSCDELNRMAEKMFSRRTFFHWALRRSPEFDYFGLQLVGNDFHPLGDHSEVECLE
jgi:hypothetical protein